MFSSSDRLLITWNTRQKDIPPRPRSPSQYPKTDPRHWHDMEYAGWGVQKCGICESPGDGARGKRVAFLQPGLHPYHVAFAEGLSRIAERAGVALHTLPGAMTMESQDGQVHRAIAERPDLVILVPISSEACTRWVQQLHAQGIPVIVSNFIPNEEAYRFILAWCGPDDWGQYRMLARSFAEKLRHKGGYAIVRHIPGSSCYEARTWSVITELAAVAPRMRCLAMGDSSREGTFDPAMTAELVGGWLSKFGSDLRGIVGPDDDIAVEGINEALRAAGREDVVRVGAGSTHAGMCHVKEGRLHAITFQPAQADGALAMKIAVDWFSGLDVQPINYLPKHIITRENVDDFISKKPVFSTVSIESLTRAVVSGSEEDVERFFEDAYQSLLSAELVTPEFFNGFSIEVLSALIHVLKMNDLDEQALLSDYESLYKNLFNQKTPRRALEWMLRTAKEVIQALARARQAETPIARIIRYVTRNYAEPLSLKILAAQFGISAPYLGRQFHAAAGKPFATYLNELRIRKAEELLRYAPLKASEIAARIGYANVNYFYTLFKKYKGYYPSESKSRACTDDLPTTKRPGPVVHSLERK
jgi:ABC-type sugar transport system substrate-binding protein/AraC-like DNA-binding protein